jgi:putative phosphoesterase
MFVGIISDTHDDMEQIRKSVELLNERAAGHIIHAGDHCSPFTFEIMGSLKGAYTGIFGNNDGDRVLLREKSDERIHNQPHTLTISEKEICVVHEPASVDALVKSGKYDIVIYGHTHRPEIRNEGKTLVINPGKVARLHKGKSTLVVLNTSSMEAELIEL